VGAAVFIVSKGRFAILENVRNHQKTAKEMAAPKVITVTKPQINVLWAVLIIAVVKLMEPSGVIPIARPVNVPEVMTAAVGFVKERIRLIVVGSAARLVQKLAMAPWLVLMVNVR